MCVCVCVRVVPCVCVCVCVPCVCACVCVPCVRACVGGGVCVGGGGCGVCVCVWVCPVCGGGSVEVTTIAITVISPLIHDNGHFANYSSPKLIDFTLESPSMNVSDVGTLFFI